MSSRDSTSLDEATALFAERGLTLSHKARESMALALALARSAANLDDTYVSWGLRKTNSLLALLADKYRLDFGHNDEEIETELDMCSEEALRSELRRRGVDSQSSPDEDDPYVRPLRDRSYEGVGEGEIDPALLEQPGLLGSPSETIVSLACAEPGSQRRGIVESFDLIRACSQLPLTAAVFEAHKLDEEKVASEINRYRLLEPFAEAQRLVLRIDHGRIHVDSFSLLDGFRYEERRLAPTAVKVQLVTPWPFVQQDTLLAFEDLVNSQSVSEEEIHLFVERHPELLLGDQYRTLHSKVVLERPEGSLIPDFFAESVTTGYSDIIELKKPNERLIVGRRDRRGFSASVLQAVYQLHAYATYFDNARQRGAFQSATGIRVFRPKLAVIIGRSAQTDTEELLTARKAIYDADILTFDDILKRAEQRMITVGAQ